jgi:hypothetical protein
MRKKLTLLIAVASASLLLAAVALAAYPKVPSKWSGGNGKGSPVAFNLNKKGKATFALAVFPCKKESGMNVVGSKHPSGTVSKSGKLTITYSAKVGAAGKENAKLVIDFTSKTKAKGTAYNQSAKCGNSKWKFTATAS